MRIKHVRHAAEVIAIIAAGVWAAYVFLYEERLKPLAEPPRLTVTPSWSVKHEGAYDLVSYSIQFRNEGPRVIDVAAEEVSVYGMTAGKPGSHKPVSLPEWNAQPYDYLKRGPLVFSSGRLRAGAVGGNRNSHILLYGNQAMIEQNPILVPRGRYIALEVDFVVVFGTAPISPPYHVPLTRDAAGAYHIGGNVPQDNDTSIVPL